MGNALDHQVLKKKLVYGRITMNGTISPTPTEWHDKNPKFWVTVELYSASQCNDTFLLSLR